MEKNSPASPELCVIYSTAPPLEADKLAKNLVERHLAACVNIVPVHSYYSWKGELCTDDECLLIAKTRKAKADEVIQAIKEMHQYDVPEIIALPVIACHTSYLEWVYGETKGS